MTTDLEARLLSVERLNKYLTSGRAGDQLVEQAIERFNTQSGVRHRLMVAEVRKVSSAIRKLAKVIQNNGRTLPP